MNDKHLLKSSKFERLKFLSRLSFDWPRGENFPKPREIFFFLIVRGLFIIYSLYYYILALFIIFAKVSRAAESNRRDVMGIGGPRACTLLSFFFSDSVFPSRCGFALRRQRARAGWAMVLYIRSVYVRAYTAFVAQKVRIWCDVGKDTLNIWPFALSLFRLDAKTKKETYSHFSHTTKN